MKPHVPRARLVFALVAVALLAVPALPNVAANAATAAGCPGDLHMVNMQTGGGGTGVGFSRGAGVSGGSLFRDPVGGDAKVEGSVNYEDGCVTASGGGSVDGVTPPANNAPSPASTPSGPTSGSVSISYTFSTSATDPDAGDSIKYEFNWGDGSSSFTGFVSSGSGASLSHTWSSSASFNVQARAIDNHGASGSWSGTHAINIGTNTAPIRPGRPTGPASGTSGTSYSFSVYTTDPNSDLIQYEVAWGDGSTSLSAWVSSGTTSSLSHSWSTTGWRYVNVRASDNKGHTSAWSLYQYIFISNPNNAPDKPALSGSLASAYVNEKVSFSGLSSDPDGGNVRLLFDWGDSTTTQNTWYPSGGWTQLYALHSWSAPGMYNVRVQANDEEGYNSPWSDTRTITITYPPPAAPGVSGPSAGLTGIPITFNVTDTNRFGSQVRFSADWGDGQTTLTDWFNSGSSTWMHHSWPTPGAVAPKFRVVDNHAQNSAWTTFNLNLQSRAPEKPYRPAGPSAGALESMYTYSALGRDPDADNVRYEFDWGDGSKSTTAYVASESSAQATHAWNLLGTYSIKVRAQDSHNVWGPLSDVTNVTIVAVRPGEHVPAEQEQTACMQIHATPEPAAENLTQAINCPAPSLQRNLPSTWLDSFEAPVSATTSFNHDWDHDGIPDVLDAVNLAGEARRNATATDYLTLLQGLESNGFLLLVEPAHKEAYLLTAGLVASPVASLNASATLDLIEAQSGTAIRNALAAILHDDLVVHHQQLLLNIPLLNQAFPWSAATLPVDGSWLLVRTDATRSVELELGGLLADLAAPLPSQLLADSHELRWEFINAHKDSSFCYDAAMTTGASSCHGNTDPGWIRAYSGQAAYALQIVWSALGDGLLPLAAAQSVPVSASMCSSGTGAVVSFVEECIPDCSPNPDTILALCNPPVSTACPTDSAGLVINGNDSSCMESCPPDEDTLPLSNCAPGIENCPSGYVGVTLSGWPACYGNCPQSGLCILNVPGSEPCQNSVGENGFCFSNCPPVTFGACLPTYHTCTWPTAGVVVNGIELCSPPLGQDPQPQPDSPESPEQSSPDSSSEEGSADSSSESPPNDGGESSTSSLDSAEAIAQFRLPEKGVKSVFDSDSSWRVLGNQSKAFQDGVGVNYLFDLFGLDPGQPLVRQAASIQDARLPPQLRPFHFAGTYYRIPAQPTDITHVSLGIESIDGNAAGQSFLLDGKALASLLPLGGDNNLVVEIDEAHKLGFQYAVRDVDGDGYKDVLVWIPHFSQAWINIYSSQACSYVRFWDVKVVSSTSAWMSSTCGSVYEYKGFDSNGNLILQGYPITVPGVGTVASTQMAFGLHMMGPREFYVVGEGDRYGGTNQVAFIAHFQNTAFDSLTWIGNTGSQIYDVWMNPSKTKGYAGGSGVGLLQYNGANWVPAAFPNALHGSCSILDIELDDNGRGYFALAADDVCRQNNDANAYSLMYTDGSTLRAEAYSGQPYIYDVQGPNGGWAVGIPFNNGVGIYQKVGSSWQQVYSYGGRPPIQAYFGVASVPGTSTTWFVSDDNNRDHTAPYYTSYLIRNTGGSWDDSSFTTDAGVPGDSTLHRVAFLDSSFGLAVGDGVILKFKTNSPPVIPSNGGYVSNQSPTTQDTVTVDARNVYDPDSGDTLSFTWYWGDGSVSTTSSANAQVSHRYNDAGSRYITLVVRDREASASKSWLMDVKAQDLSLPTSNLAQAFTGSGMQRYHYHILNSRGLFVEATLTGCDSAGNTYLRLLGNLGGAVPRSAGNPWSSSIKSAKILAGQVSATQDLYLAVEKLAGSSSASCNLSVRAVPAPNAPSIVSLPGTAGANRAVALSASVTSTGGYPVTWHVNWDTSNPSSGLVRAGTGFVSSGTTQSLSKTYTTPGTYRISIRSQDSLGQWGGTTPATINVFAPPTSQANSVADPGDNEAGLSGSVTNFGGAGSVTARYLVYAGTRVRGDPVVATASEQVNNCGSSSCTIPVKAPDTLQAGRAYTYVVEVNNGPYTTTSNAVTFWTDKGTDTTPTFTSAPSTVNAGTSVSFSFKADRAEAQNVAYTITWGDGTSSTTAFVASNAVQSLSHTYAFPLGAVSVGAQLQTASGGWSTTIHSELNVGGSPPAYSVTHDPQLNAAALTAHLNGNIYTGDTQLRFMYRDPAWGNWIYSGWLAASANGAPSTTVTGLNPALTYDALVDFKANGGAARWTTSASWSFRSNQAPTLQPVEAESRTATYLDDVSFAVTYQDYEGNAPTSGVSLTINDQSYTMFAPSGTLGAAQYQAGVSYRYVLHAGDLPAPGSYVPKYAASDLYQAASEYGAAVTVTQASVASHTFTDDAIGDVPRGFTLSDEPVNFWRVVDTDAAGFADLAALGGHGKAAWFGHAPGSYNDPEGGVPKGTLQSTEYDLSSITKPVLSFASYYDTEQREDRDRKVVYIQSRSQDSGSNDWSLAQPVLTLQGDAGGYKKWRTQSIDLTEYAGKVIRILFRFDAVTTEDNNHLGWLIDDFAIGHDQDGDSLPDTLEQDRLLAFIRNPRAPGVKVATGSDGVAVVRRFQQQGAEDVTLEAVLASKAPNQLSVELGVVPDLSTDGLGGAPSQKTVLLSLPTGFASTTTSTVCGLTGSVKSPFSPWYDSMGDFLLGSPIGYPNPAPAGKPYVTSAPSVGIFNDPNSGVKLQINATRCLQALGSTGFGKVPLDVYLKVHDASSTETATIEQFRIVTNGRTSSHNGDSDSDGVSDSADGAVRTNAVGATSSSTPMGLDQDADSIAAQLDGDDSLPDLIPGVQIDLRNQANRVRVGLGTGFIPGWTSFYYREDGKSIPAKPIDTGSFIGWELKPAQDARTLVATWRSEHGNQLTLTMPRSFSRSGAYVVSSLTHEYYSGKYNWVIRTDLQTSGEDSAELYVLAMGITRPMVEAFTAIDWPIPVELIGWAAGKAVIEPTVDYFAGELRKNNAYNVNHYHAGSSLTVNQDWWPPTGSRKTGIILPGYPSKYGADASELASYFGTPSVALPALNGAYRFVHTPGNGDVYLIDVDVGGRVLDYTKARYPSMSVMLGRTYLPGDVSSGDGGAAWEILGMERLLASDSYGNAGSNLPCHTSCFLPETRMQVVSVDSSFVAPREGANGNRRMFGAWGMLEDLRDSHYRASSDFKLGENVLGLESLAYAYRMARTTLNPTSPEFVTYWGSANDGSCDQTPSHRRCMDLDLDPVDQSQPQSVVEPFTIKWMSGNSVMHTEMVGVNCRCWFRYGYDVLPNGKSRVESTQTDAGTALSQYNFNGKPANAIAFDLTGPLDAFTKLPPYNFDPATLSRNDMVFSQAYGVA